MPHVKFTPIALEDLLQIWVYIANESDEEIADSFADAILAKCEAIGREPLGYRERPELLKDIRSFPFKSYVIFYLPIANGIEVLRILHGARDIERVFEDTEPSPNG